MRSIGMDVHRDFCEVAILVHVSGRRTRGRVASKLEDLQLFAQSPGPDDRVALEVTANAWEIARILEPHVARVNTTAAPSPDAAVDVSTLKRLSAGVVASTST